MLALFELLILVQRVPLYLGALHLLQVQRVELLELVDLLQLHKKDLVGLDFLYHGDELLARLEVQRQHLDIVQQVDHLVVLKEGVHRLLHIDFEALVRAHDLVGVVALLDLLSSVVIILLHLLLRPGSQLHILLQELHELLMVDVAHSAYTVRPEMALQAFDANPHAIELILKLVNSLHLHLLVEHINLRLSSNHTRTPIVQRALTSSYFHLFVWIDVVGGLVFLGVNIFDDGFLLNRLRNLAMIIVFSVITRNDIILMTWTGRILQLLTSAFVCLFLDLSKLFERIIFLLLLLKVILAFRHPRRTRLIIFDECVNLIESFHGFVRQYFD